MALNQSDLILLRGMVVEKESQLRTLIVNAVEAGEVGRAKNMVEALRDFEGLHGRIQGEVKAGEKETPLTGVQVTPVSQPIPKPAQGFALPTRANAGKPADNKSGVF